MKEQLQDKLVEILTSIQQATGAAGDFAIEQLPDVANQYILYGRILTVILTTFFLIAAAVLFATFRWAYKNPWNVSTHHYDQGKARSESNYLVMVVSLVLGGSSTLISVLSFDLMVWVAPKVWLLKQLATFVR